MKLKLIEIAGWYGAIAIIGAYALASFNIISSQSLSYQILNITGALGLILVSWKKKVYQSVVLNIIWTFIGLAAVYNILISQQGKSYNLTLQQKLKSN